MLSELGRHLPAVALRLLLWLLSIILLPTQKVYSGPGTSLHWIDRFGASICPWNSASAIIFLISLGFAALCLSWMSGWSYAHSDLSTLRPQDTSEATAEQTQNCHAQYAAIFGEDTHNIIKQVSYLNSSRSSLQR